MIQSFLSTILDGSELSDVFLKTYRVIAFPIANPDGVDLGHWRHNHGGIDLNRDWSVYNQPEIKQIVKFINNASEEDEGAVILGLDFHSTKKDIFYTNKIVKLILEITYFFIFYHIFIYFFYHIINCCKIHYIILYF